MGPMITTLIASLALHAAPAGATLASGHHFACALAEGGTVYCWGENLSGQLGDGTRGPRTTPVRVLGLRGARDIACGAQHACARNDAGEVFCWGHNGLGQSGDPLELFLLRPRKVNGLPPVARIFAGEFSTCAAGTDGKLWCWGRNMHGQLATPRRDRETGRPTPSEISGVSDPRSVVFSEGHVCAATAQGEVLCWGDNDHNRAGGKGKSITTPTRVAGVENAVSLAATNLATFARLADGRLVWWGARQAARDYESAATPKDDGAVSGLFTNRYAFYVRRGESAWTFPGSGVAPLLPSADLSWATELVAGDNYACGRAREGGVRCWGWNGTFGVGTGSTTPVKEPVAVRLDAPELAPPRARLPELERCDEKPPAPVAAPAPRPSCGNGQLDVIGMTGGECAPCMPGRSCPCSPRAQVMEPCDGADLGGQTCESLGFGGGRLRCSSSCSFDDSQCVPKSGAPTGAVAAWPRIPEAKLPGRALDLAAGKNELGAVWTTASGCGRAVLARFSKDLSLISTSNPFGRPNATRVRLVPMLRGWLVAVGSRGGRSGVTTVHFATADGKPGPEKTALLGLPVFLEAASPEGPWLLGLVTREHEYLGGLTVAVLDARGTVVAEREVFGNSAYASVSVESLPTAADSAAAIAWGDGFLVARSQQTPGNEAGGVVVARVSRDGRLEAASLVAATAAAPFWLGGEEKRLGWLRNKAPPGQPGRFVVETAAVSPTGALAGAVETLAELEESEWYLSGAAQTKSWALLAPRIDLSGSTIQSSFVLRLDLLEQPKLRSTLIEGKGVAESRLVTFGDFLVAGWLWSGGGPKGLGLVKVLPAAAR